MHKITNFLTAIIVLLLIIGCTASQAAEPIAQPPLTATASRGPTATATRRPTLTPRPTSTDRPIIVTDDGDPLIPLTISPLSDDPCAAPCWYGITPGITNIDEAWTILFDEWDQESVCPNTFTRDVIGCENFRVIASEEHGVVENIILTPTEGIRMEDVIQAFGEPEIIFLNRWGIDYPERVEIIFPFRDQTVFIVFNNNGWVYRVDPQMRVEEMIYAVDGTWFDVDRSQEYSMFWEEEWRGYGDYDPGTE